MDGEPQTSPRLSRASAILLAVLDTDAGSALNSLAYSRLDEGDSRELLHHVIRRLAFPLVPVGACAMLAIVGHASSRLCLSGLLGSSPMWYLVSFLIVAYPFATLWPNRGDGFSRELVLGLSSVALGIGFFEAILVELLDRDVAWAAGFSLYTLVGLVAVPCFFYLELSPQDAEEQNKNDSSGSTLAVAATIISVVLSLASAWGYTATHGSGAKQLRIDQSTQDDWWKSLVVYTLLPAQAVVLIADRKRKIRFSFAYCLFFSVLGTRVPDFLSFGSVRLFTLLGHEADERFDHKYAMLSRYGVSMGFLLSMTLYMHILKRVVASMSAPNLFPRFLFHAQLYYYCCYYLLVSAAREMDALFWIMVLSMNVYYVITNTGIAADLMRCRPSRQDNDFLALVYRIKLADQDSLADVTALWAVPSILTAFAQLASKDAMQVAMALRGNSTAPMEVRVEHYNGAPLDLRNLWLRFFIMFVARLASSRASKFVFSFKLARDVRKSVLARVTDPEMLTDAAQRQWLRSRQHSGSEPTPVKGRSSEDGDEQAPHSRDVFEIVVAREFRQVFPYFALVAMHALYSLFQNPNLPGRYTFWCVLGVGCFARAALRGLMRAFGRAGSSFVTVV